MKTDKAAPAWTMLEVAQVLGVSQRTVKRRVSDGSINVIRLGRVVRVPDTEVARILSL